MPGLAEKLKKIKALLGSGLLLNTRRYLLANLISGAIPFVLLPVLTRYLSPEDFGTVALYTVLSTVASALLTLGVNGAVSRIYFDLDEKEFPAFVGTCLVIVGMCASMLSVPIFIGHQYIVSLTSFPAPWLWAVGFTACAQALFSIALAVFQVRNMAGYFGIAQVVQSLLLAIFTLFFVVVLNFDWRGRVLAQTLSTGFAALGVVCYLARRCGVPLAYHPGHGRRALRYGVPLVVHVLSGIAISMSDRLIITRLLTLRETGLYAAAAQVTTALVFVIDAFNRAYAPWLFRALSSGDVSARFKVVRGTYLYFILIFFAALAFSAIIGSFMSLFLGEAYARSAEYILWMSLSAAFMGMYYMVTLYIQYANRTEFLAGITFSVGAMSVASCYLLVISYGGIGAAYSSVFAQLCMFLASWLVAAWLVPMPWFKLRSKA